jgi:Transposase domain (DUF772)
VALLLYSYACGNRSSRGIERKCREDVAYRVICANLVPDHSTIAEFRKRHEAALGELFTSVLSLCSKARLVKVGVIAVDGTKISANASMDANASYERVVREILAEAEETDRCEDELHGDARGDELPEQLRSREGRRAAFRDAKRALDAEHEASGESGEAANAEPIVALDLDRERLVNSEQGRRGWLREGAVSWTSIVVSRRGRSPAQEPSDCRSPSAGWRRSIGSRSSPMPRTRRIGSAG